MIEEETADSLIPEEVNRLRRFVEKFPEEFEVDERFFERREEWINLHGKLLTEYEKGRLSREEYLELVGGLTTAEQWLSDHDALTGLFNRRGFDEVLKILLEKAETAGDKLTVMVFDIDGLKEINDQFGHNAGDKVIKAVAASIKETGPEGSLSARIGGDEFALIIPRKSLAESKETGLEIINQVKSLPPVDGLKIKISVGGGEWRPGDDQEKFTERINKKAFYPAKESSNIISNEEGGGVLGMVE